MLPILVLAHTAEPGFIERTVSGEALLIRQETVFVAPVSGKLVQSVKEGERVRVGTPIAQISNPRTARAFDEQISVIDQRIAEFDRANGLRVSALEQALSGLDTTIMDAFGEARRVLATNDTDRLGVLDKILGEAVVKRGETRVDLDRLDSVRKEMVQERQRLIELARKATNLIEAPSPGVVSFVLDGLERQFAIGKTEGLTSRAVFTAQPKAEESKTGDEVKAGKPILKIIGLDQVHLAMPLKLDDLMDVATSQTVRVKSDSFGSKTYPARVVSITDPGADGYGVVVVSLSPFPEEAFQLRRVKVDLIKDRREGIVVPEQCLTERNGETGVYVIFKTMAQFRRVTVKARHEGKVVLSGIEPGVEVIKNHWLVRDGLKVR